jgi:hypothetical protein
VALNKNRLARLVRLAAAELSPGQDDKRAEAIERALPRLIKEAERAPTTDERERAGLIEEKDEGRLRTLIVRLLGTPEVEAAWARLEAGERRARPLRPGAAVLRAGARLAADRGHPDPIDSGIVSEWVQQKGKPAMPRYEVERRGLPSGFDERAFVDAVAGQLADLNFPQEDFPAFHAVVVGKLLLQGHIDPGRSDFSHALRRAYVDGIAATKGRPAPGEPVPSIKNYRTYDNVAQDIALIRGDDPIRYQEVASVADYVVSGADDWPVNDPTTRRIQVNVGLTRYVDGSADTGFSALALPPVISEDASQQEMEPSNIEAVAMVAACAEIEQTGAFDVVDRMLDLFLQGLLPVRDDSGGRALDKYYWESEDRLDPAARAQQYARVVGYAGGGATSTDVQNNAAFSDYLLRSASILARYDSDMRIANVVAINRQETSGSSEYARKSLHDLGANASLYGWGFTIFAARRLKRHVDQVFEVLGQESLQRAYGVTGPWQLVERVSALELGAAPNVVMHRTMAKATKDILDIVAKYATQLSVSGANGRFLPSAAEVANNNALPDTVVSVPDYIALVGAANNILAVNGVSETDVYRMAQPTRAALAPSIPTVGPGTGSNGDGTLDHIRQLVAQGQAPTLEQLVRLGLG